MSSMMSTTTLVLRNERSDANSSQFSPVEASIPRLHAVEVEDSCKNLEDVPYYFHICSYQHSPGPSGTVN